MKVYIDFGIELYGLQENKLSESHFVDIVSEAVSIEKEFITESLPCNLLV